MDRKCGRLDGNHSLDLPPLHNAASCDRTDIVDLLLKKGVNVNARDSIGGTACHMVVRTLGINSVRRLLDAGCGLELMDYQGMTAVHFAALYGYYDFWTGYLKVERRSH